MTHPRAKTGNSRERKPALRLVDQNSKRDTITSKSRAIKVYVSSQSTPHAMHKTLPAKGTIVIPVRGKYPSLDAGFDIQQSGETSHQHARQRPRVSQRCLDFTNKEIAQLPSHRLENHRGALFHVKPQPPVCSLHQVSG